MKKGYKIEVYTDSNNEWRFSVVASNGRIVADSGEGYKTKFFCMRNIHNLMKLLPSATITSYE